MNSSRSESRGERLLVAAVRLVAPADRVDEIAGDLWEEAERRVLPAHGPRWATVWLVLQVVASAPHLVGMRLRRLWPERPARGFVDGDDTLVTGLEAQAAFASFLAEARARRSLPRVPLALALAAHVVLFAVAAFASLWPSLDELAPPAVIVTWMPAAPPAMQEVPRPAGKRSEATRSVDRKHAGPKRVLPAPAAQATAIAPEATSGPASDGVADDANEQGGSGTDGGGEGDQPTHVLPPQVVARQCLACEPPALPPAWITAGMDQRVLARVCVGADGVVEEVRVLQGVSPAADESVARTLRAWRFSPYRVQGRPVPFCYTTRIVFKTR